MHNSYEEKYWNVSETGFISIQCLETFNWLTYITYTHMQEQVFMHTHGYNLLLDTAVTEHLTPNSLWCRDSSSMTLQFDHLDKTSAPSGQESGAQPFVHLIQRQINLHWWKHTDNNSCLMSLSAKCRSLRINSALGQIPAKCSTVIINNCKTDITYLCMVPTSAGSDERWFPDRFNSVSEEMSHKARGNSDRVLFDRLRLLSLQNLESYSESHWDMREGEEEEGRQRRTEINLSVL